MLVPCCRPSTSVGTKTKSATGVFLVKPYLQIGNPQIEVGKGYELTLLWHASDGAARWVVDYCAAPNAGWQEAAAPTMRWVNVPGIAPHSVYQTILKGLEPGALFAYRVRQGAGLVFSAEGHTPKAPGQQFRFVAFGDCGAGTVEQRAIAYQAYQNRPDLLLITGDIVYTRGQIDEYRANFWPIYNADEASLHLGAPLLRSIPFVAAPGNHDIGSRDLGAYPRGLAYFLYWAQPLNGPTAVEGGPLVPRLAGPDANKQAFLTAAGLNYPRMANFSFDYGDTHWTILDSNPYVDWADVNLRAWVEHDLATARGQTWRFVAFHHPGFNSSKAHFQAQHTRLLADLFEAHEVDVVFNGHVHNYQRTYPLRFVAEQHHPESAVRGERQVPGRWALDKVFDGQTNTQPHGVIYLITGAGGNNLYNREQQDDPDSWQPFTARFISKQHSLTVADVDGSTLTVRQLSASGEQLDRFVITKRIFLKR